MRRLHVKNNRTGSVRAWASVSLSQCYDKGAKSSPYPRHNNRSSVV